MQSDKTLTTQIYFLLNIQQMESFLIRLCNKSTKRTNNEAKFKKESTFSKPTNVKSLKSHYLLTN